ncbi:MAG: DUF2587 domain-containing protein [Actinomycetota bacterium]|jgi:hypothetical protein|uniref:proteasome activator n=1 Tax=uncultured Ilumatobacter sp. TaxID=879968 RepID=UPI00374F6619|nr:DUF2587 domain-containing protein [Actinomycetota bacterium]
MSDTSSNLDATPAETVRPQIVFTTGETPAESRLATEPTVPREAVTQPAKVMRIGSMIKQLLEEVRMTSLDEASRERLAEVYERSIIELSAALSEDLQEELRSLALPFDHDEVPSEAELRVAKAQLVGWLEGLFHGIQASLMAQQAVAQQQLAQMRQLSNGEVVQGGAPHGSGQPAAPVADGDRPGTYL